MMCVATLITAEIKAAMGIVNIQAQTMFPATPSERP
jgi:hypothetical protein